MTSTTAAPVAEVTRERIRRLADELFAHHGYAAVSMREVAAAAGVTKPALYYHFRDKEALFEECVLLTHQRLHALLRAAIAGSRTFEERVCSVALVLLTGSAHHPVRTQADVAEHLPAEVRQRIERNWAEVVTTPVVELFAEAGAEEGGGLRAGVAPAQAAAALMGATMSFRAPMRSRDGVIATVARAPLGRAPAAAPEETARLIAAVVLHGVATRP